MSNWDKIFTITQIDVDVLHEKGKTYGDSWKRRGGVGAFMMLARKWDRIENIATEAGYDIFTAGVRNTGDIMDDIRDLRRYLLLVEDEVWRLEELARIGLDGELEMVDTSEPQSQGYVNQDPK